MAKFFDDRTPMNFMNVKNRDYNDHIWVKMTSHGEQIIKNYCKRVGIRAPTLERDARGWTRMHFGEVVQLFGNEMYSGNSNLPIKNTFLAEAPKK